MDFNSIRDDITVKIKDTILLGELLTLVDEFERIENVRIKASRWMSRLTIDVLEAVNYDEEKFLKQVENGSFATELLRRANG